MSEHTIKRITPMTFKVQTFMRESLNIEGITRDTTLDEIQATEEFFHVRPLGVNAVWALQRVYAPGHTLRTEPGCNVHVGSYIAPRGGPKIPEYLDLILKIKDPWYCHVQFELLHPFTDGNGRTGRALWAYKMFENGQDPFALGFLHHFYYQTLAAQDPEDVYAAG